MKIPLWRDFLLNIVNYSIKNVNFPFELELVNLKI
jgi:hypothetical protein